MTNRPASGSWATRLGTASGQIAPAVRNHQHSNLLRLTGASHNSINCSLGRAGLRQYRFLPTVSFQISDETPPDSGSQMHVSPSGSRPIPPIISQIVSGVSESGQRLDGFII